MKLIVFSAGGTLLDYLFGGSVPIIGIFLSMTGLDLLTGYGKALKSHTWASSMKSAPSWKMPMTLV